VDAVRQDLLSISPTDLQLRLEDHFRGREQPRFRADQVRRWIYEKVALGVDEMTDLSLDERDALQKAFHLGEARVARVSVSEDGTTKHLWELSDGELVESVLIPAGRRLTLCISSQAGCAMGCTFCATGWGGFRRQLSTGEIVLQYRASVRHASENGLGRISNVVFMGMGEPLANRKALFPALDVLHAGFGVGARRITVSTVGVVPGILELARLPQQFRLALSLHSPDPDLRRELIPLEKRYPLADVMDALREFNQGGGRRITFEYTLIHGVNDAPELIAPLAALANDVSAFVNLIPFNPITAVDWGPSTRSRIREFEDGLTQRGVANAVREPRGRDIDAACGQLRTQELVQLGEGRGRELPEPL